MAITHSLARMLGARQEARAITEVPWPVSVGGFVSGYGTRGYQGHQVPGQVERSLQVVAVYACLRVISNSISTLPMRVYQDTADGRELVAANHPTQLRLGRYPHPRIPAGEFYGLVAAHLAAWGNAFIWKGRERAGGPVTSLFPVLPTMVGVTLDERGEPVFTVTLANGERKVTTTDVLHIRGFGVDGIVGMSPIGVARKAIDSMELEEDYRVNLLMNDARVSGILSTDQNLSSEASQRVAAQWKAAHGGPGNAGGTAVLEAGMKWQQMSLSTQDMQFIEQRNYSVAEVARLFGVPPSMINAQSQDSMTYSTVEAEGLAFVRDCLMPYLRRIEQGLDADADLVPAGLCPEFDVDGLLRADARTRAEVQQIKVGMGSLTKDEARIEDGRAPLDNDDVPVGVAPPVADTEDDA